MVKSDIYSHSGLRFAMWSLLVAIAFPFVFQSIGGREQPNIIFLLIDDQGYYDLGCYGATEVKTPNIDRLAVEGIRLTDYYAAAPICSPSRVGLLTGCYPKRVGNATWVHRADSTNGIHPNELTLAELFHDNGYTTGCIGKWHLGFREPFLPAHQGFDYYFGLQHNLDNVEIIYFKNKGGVPLMRNNEVIKRSPDPAELTSLYTDEAISFIEKNKKKPFFLYLPHTMLHNPLGVSERFQGSSDWGEYGDAIQELDHHVGRLMSCLDKFDLTNDTIVVYASDNGRGPGRNADQPIRGRKLSTYEGGIRVPAIIWGPQLGVRQNYQSSALIHAMDWYPTLSSIAGISVPEPIVLDGRDLSLLMLGKTANIPSTNSEALNASVPLRRHWNPPSEWADLISRSDYNNAFFYHGSHGALSAVRSGPWKLFLNPRLTLYNLDEDPGEMKPVFNGKVARKLRGMAIMFQDEMRRDARPGGDQFLNESIN